MLLRKTSNNFVPFIYLVFFYNSANSAVPQQSDSTSLSSTKPFGKSSTHWDTGGDLFFSVFFLLYLCWGVGKFL